MTNSSVIFFIGPQGSGKGTQAKILAEKLNFFDWDNGAILRKTAQEDSPLGRKVKQLVDNGVYLDDHVLFEVAEDKLKAIAPNQGIVFDGIPRRLSQAQFLLPFLSQQGRTDFNTIFIDIPKEETLKRLKLRADKEKRADDTPEKIELRLKQYYEETLPVVNYLKIETRFFDINGQSPIEEVTKQIYSSLGI